MNLEKLFYMQAELDKRIEKEKGLEEQDLLDEKTLALQVEIGELANEVRTWKFWSKDRTPRTRVLKHPTMNDEDKVYENRVLGEYVDGLHFILSIGNECGFENGYFYTSHKDTIVDQFNKLFAKVGDFSQYATKGNFETIFCLFLGLGEMLGFTWEQIEQAYYDKNKINLERQQNGY